MEYALNIVSKCPFLYLYIRRLQKKGLANFSWGPGKVLDVFVSKRVGTL